MSSSRLAPPIQSTLATLRRRIRGYVCSEGLALAVAWLGLAFWLSLLLDWSVEPPVLVRQIVLGIAGAGLLYVLVRYVARRIFTRIADHNLALLLERRFGQFGDSLLTTVELSEQPAHAAPFHPDMLAHTEAVAVDHVAEIDVGHVFRRGPLMRSLAAALLAIATVGAFAWFAPKAFATWTNRNLMFSDELWPRRTFLVLDGFKDKRIKVAKGSDVTIIVKADRRKEVPDSVRIRYRTEEGRSSPENMSRVGIAGEDERYQPFSFVFRGILGPRTFDVFGGDASLRDYTIDVVDVPTISIAMDCEYPAYTRKAPLRGKPVTGLMQLPQGSRLTVHATANKELVDVPITRLVGEKSEPLTNLHFGPPAREFSYVIPRLDQDQTLLFALSDTDGIKSREPIRLILNATPDEPPRVGLHLRGIGTAITPQALLPVEGDVTDDWGLTKFLYEFKIDQAEPVRVPLHTDPRGRNEMHFDRASNESLDMKERGLKVGQQLLVSVVAYDNCTLAGGPNLGLGEKFQLSVVSPDQLQSMLEARELTLRMRLEVIVQEVTDACNRLAEVDFSPGGKKPAAKPAPAPEKKAPDKKEKKSAATSVAPSAAPFVVWTLVHTNPAHRDTRDFARTKVRATTVAAGESSGKPAKKRPAGAEPEDAAPRGASHVEPGDQSEGPRGVPPAVVVEQTLAGLANTASDVTVLATSFDDIRDELANNRIDTPQMEYRLKDQIADPLRHIADPMFPELESRLRKLQTVLTDPAASRERRDDAVRQFDAILVEMHQVLNKMLELESFNEVVQQLQEIINAEKEFNKQVQEKQKRDARKLSE